MHHFCTGEPGDGVILAQKDGLFGTDFFTHPAENAANHIDIELARVFLDLAEAVFRRNFARLDFDRPRRTDEFAELTSNATDAPGLVFHQSGGTAIVFRQLRIPFFFGILHRHLGAAEEHILEMPESDRHPCHDRRQIQSIGPGEFRSWNGDSHINSCSCS